jgi:hypothetical protein
MAKPTAFPKPIVSYVGSREGTLSKWPGGDFDARCSMVVFGVAGGARTQLTKVLQLFHRQVIPEQVEEDILQATCMSVATPQP